MNHYLPAARYALAGVRRVLVAAHAPGTRFAFIDPATFGDLLYAMSPAAWVAFTAEPSATATQTGARTLTGLRYEQRLNLSFSQPFTLAQRKALTALFTAPVWCLIEDGHGAWWLAGQTRGLRCTSLTWQTGTRGGELTVAAQLDGAEPAAWREFEATAARALYATAAAAANPPGGGDIS
jgi:hypothetical protein